MRNACTLFVSSIAVFLLSGLQLLTSTNHYSKFVSDSVTFDDNHHSNPLLRFGGAAARTDGSENLNNNLMGEANRTEKLSTPTNDDSKKRKKKKKNDGKMNILLLYPDDWRHDSIEDARPGMVHTPFLSQSLAKDGIRFTHNAVTTSICWISRATLFTGRYASQHMSHRLFCPLFTLERWWKRSWPQMLKKQGGYYTGLIGKWQYRNTNEFFRKAFHFVRRHEGDHFYNMRKHNGTHIEQVRVHAADRAKDEAIEFLRKRPRNKPFALTVAFYPPKAVGSSREPGAQWSPLSRYRAMYEDHVFEEPYNLTQAFEALPHFLKTSQGRHRFGWRYNSTLQYQEAMKNYFALVSHIDDSCRDIVKELKAQGVYNNTLIIFTTDNGLLQGRHGLAGKWHPWEESIRVPLIIYDPRMPLEKRGTTDDSFTLNVDLAQTILDAAGIEPSRKMQGRSIADLYLRRGDNLTTPSTPTNENANRPWRNDFFYEFPLDDDFPASTALVRKDYKYISWTKHGYEQLFDLQQDPYELKDLRNVSGMADIVQEMRDRHDILQKEIAGGSKKEDKLECKRGLKYP